MVYREWEKMGKRVQGELMKRLTQLGEDAMNYAFEQGFKSVPRRSKNPEYLKKRGTKAWADKSYTLRDNFVSAVFVDGKLIPESVRYLNDSPQSRHGRKFAEDLLARSRPMQGSGQLFVMVAAAPMYVAYLEQGRHRGGYKIRVISGASSYIREHIDEVVVGIYKRWGIRKPKYRVIRGDIRNTYYEYTAKGK